MVSVKRVSEAGQTNILIDKATVSIGSVIEVSDDGGISLGAKKTKAGREFKFF